MSPEPPKADELAARLAHPKQAAAELRRALEDAADRSAIARIERLMPGVARVYGTSMSVVSKLAAELARLGRSNPTPVIQVLDVLWNAGSLEERQLAGKVLERLGKWHPEECLAAVERYVPTLDCWANVDNLACFSMKEIASRDPPKALSRVRAWIRDDRKWTRRFGVVVLRAFEKREAPPEVFELLDSLRDEPDADVQKAIAWMLRDLSTRHGAEVTKLLSNWLRDGLQPGRTRMVREGMKKLPASDQARLKKLLAAGPRKR